MSSHPAAWSVWLTLFCALSLCTPSAAEQSETPARGAVLKFVVGSKVTTYDGHRETSFGVLHPFAPFHSLLIRVNPDDPQSPTDLVCDLCEGQVPQPTRAGKPYTFTIRDDVRFHNGTPLSAADIKASLDNVMFPPEKVLSARRAFNDMVAGIEAPNPHTLVINLKFASTAFLPALANPFNWIYAKADLDANGYEWYARNINGTGPFIFVQHQAGAFVEGERYPSYHHTGRPYLNGFKAISAPKMPVRLQVIHGNRVAIEFRGFPPTARDVGASRAEAIRLLEATGATGSDFRFHNRGVDQPYKFVATWLLDQWRKVGLRVSQRTQSTPPSWPRYANTAIST